MALADFDEALEGLPAALAGSSGQRNTSVKTFC